MKRLLHRLAAPETWVYVFTLCAVVGIACLILGIVTGSAVLKLVGIWLIAPHLVTGLLLGVVLLVLLIRHRTPLGIVATLPPSRKKGKKACTPQLPEGALAPSLAWAAGEPRHAQKRQEKEMILRQTGIEGVTVVFPGVCSPVPDTRTPVPDEKTHLQLEELPPHWLNHLGVIALGADGAHDIRFPTLDGSLTTSWLQNLCGALGLDTKFQIKLREFTEEVELLRSFNASPWAFPIRIQQRSYNLALAMGLVAARVQRPLPRWVLFTGVLEYPFRPMLEFERTGYMEDKIRLALAYPPEKYDVRPLLKCLYEREHLEGDITTSILGRREDRTVSGEVRLFFVPDTIYLDEQERMSDLLKLPKDFEMEQVEQVDKTLLQRFQHVHPDDHQALEDVVTELRAGFDLLVLQVSSALQPLFVMGYHKTRFNLESHHEQVALKPLRGYRIRLTRQASEHRTRTYVRRFADAELRQLEQQLPATADIHARIDLILHRCVDLLDCSSGCVAMTGPAIPEGQFYVWARHGGTRVEGGTRIDGMPPYVPADRGLIAAVVRRGRHVILENAQQSEEFKDTLEWTRQNALRSHEHNPHIQDWLATLEKVGSCVAYPVKQGSRVIGVLCLHRDSARPFNPDMIEVVEELVERIAIEAGAALSVLDYLHEVNRTKEGEFLPPSLVGQRQVAWPARELIRQCEALALAFLRRSRGYRASVCLITQDRQKLRVVAAVEDPARPNSWPADHRKTLIDRAEKTAGNFALRTRRSVVIPDTRQASAYYKPVDPPACATASIVIYHGPHVLGIASVDWDRPLSPVESQLMRRALEQIALGYAADLRFLLMANERRHLDEWFDRLDMESEPDYMEFIWCVVRMLGTDRGALFLRDPATGKHRLVARPSRKGIQLPDLALGAGKGFPGWVAKHQAPLRVSDVHNSEELEKIQPEPPRPIGTGVAGEPDVESLMGVPLKGDGGMFGVVLAMTPRRDPGPGSVEAQSDDAYPIAYGFDDYDQQLLQAAANRLGGWLREREKKHRQRELLKLADQASLVRVYLEEPNTWDETRIPTTYHLGCIIREVLEKTIGPCNVVLRPLNKRQFRGNTPEDVLDLIAFDRDKADAWPIFRVKGERAAGEAWEKGKTIRKTHSGEDPDRPAGDYASTPIFGQTDAREKQIVGVVTVHKEQVGALSDDEVRFLEIVALRAGRAFPLLYSMDVRRLQESILWHTLVYAQDRNQDNWLADIGRALAIALEAREECAVWRVAGDRFTGVTSGCHNLPAPRDLTQTRVERVLKGNSFVVVSCPEKDTLLEDLCAALPKEYPVEVKNRQQAAFLLGHPKRPQALFFLVAEPPHRLNYLLAERASRMLHTVITRAVSQQ